MNIAHDSTLISPSFRAQLEPERTYFWRVQAKYGEQKLEWSTVFVLFTQKPSHIVSDLKNGSIPEGFVLSQNYPNPFNPRTTIRYRLPQEAHVRLSVVNPLGQEIVTLVDEKKNAGHSQIAWDGHDSQGIAVASGLYLCTMVVGYFKVTKKMLLVY